MEVYGLFRKSNGRTVQGMIKMKRQLPYYIIVRSNGGIITGAYANALLCGHYVCGKVFILEFGDFESAEEYLLEHLAEVTPPGCLLPEHCRLNEMVSTPGRIINS